MHRWKSEVEADISSLESSIASVTGRIDNMYEEEALRQREYRLHAVLVHEGGTDSGHYWAYVRDHRRKAWLKCNDNAITEATWDELLCNSVGGHFNTSAYSLMYIAASKADELMLAEDAAVPPASSDDKMDSSSSAAANAELDALLRSLPNDLADFVSADNSEFQNEKIRWDEEAKKKKQRQEDQEMVTVR